jgi:beta-galactosidase beta subunit
MSSDILDKFTEILRRPGVKLNMEDLTNLTFTSENPDDQKEFLECCHSSGEGTVRIEAEYHENYMDMRAVRE